MKKYDRDEVRMSEEERNEIFERAKTNRKRVRSGLDTNGDPTPVGLRTQGSYAMRTMIRYRDGDYDIDDGIYFKRDDLKEKEGEDKSPLEARRMVCRSAADERFKDAPEVRDNCVRIFFNEGYHIDLPVYRETKETDSSTGDVKKSFELASKDKWRESDPLANTKWFRDSNSTKSSDATANGNDGQFVRVVRLLKAFARSRASWCSKTTTGFAIAKLTYDHFGEILGRDDQCLRDMAKVIVGRLKMDESIKHPKLNENLAEKGDDRVKFFCEKLEENLEYLNVLDKSDCSHAEGMKAWDSFFNTDWFSKQPDPEEDDGLKKALSPAVIKRGETRYARPDTSA